MFQSSKASTLNYKHQHRYNNVKGSRRLRERWTRTRWSVFVWKDSSRHTPRRRRNVVPSERNGNHPIRFEECLRKWRKIERVGSENRKTWGHTETRYTRGRDERVEWRSYNVIERLRVWSLRRSVYIRKESERRRRIRNWRKWNYFVSVLYVWCSSAQRENITFSAANCVTRSRNITRMHTRILRKTPRASRSNIGTVWADGRHEGTFDG